MFLRVLRICSSEYTNCEIEKIYDIATNLKYPNNIIDCALARARKKHHDVTDNNFSSKNLLVLPYHDNFANIPQVLKTLNVNVSFKNNCTVNNELIKNSPQCNEGCIYTVPCKNWNRFYIGQTGKRWSKERNNTSTQLKQDNSLMHYLYM